MAEKILPEQIPDRTITDLVDFGHDVTFQWVDGHIAVLTIRTSTREAVDTYIELSKALLPLWLENGAYILNDASYPDVSVTPYFKHHLNELAEEFKENNLQGYSALVLQRGFMSLIVKIFGNTFANTAGQLEQKYFTDYDEALKWLQSKLPDAEE